MQGTFIHWCIHVLDLEKSLEFYEKALGYAVHHTMGPEDGSWSNTFMAAPGCPFELELTWNRGRTEEYENGGMDCHIAFRVDDIGRYHELHERMGCIQKENPKMGLYFIVDPDGQRIEILPERA